MGALDNGILSSLPCHSQIGVNVFIVPTYSPYSGLTYDDFKQKQVP